MHVKIRACLGKGWKLGIMDSQVYMMAWLVLWERVENLVLWILRYIWWLDWYYGKGLKTGYYGFSGIYDVWLVLRERVENWVLWILRYIWCLIGIMGKGWKLGIMDSQVYMMAWLVLRERVENWVLWILRYIWWLDWYYGSWRCINPLPHMPILDPSDSAAVRNMMSKIWTNGVQLSDWV